MTRGWWRRNRWGVLLLVPVMGLGVAEPIHDQWHVFWDTAPRTPVSGAAGGWVTFAGADFRLDSLAPVTTFTNDFGKPVALPTGMSVWRASIAVKPGQHAELDRCDIRMVDTAGTTFDDNPSELADAGIFPAYTSCNPPGDAATPPASWTDVAYFVAPIGVHPTAVRVLIDPELPTYALLTR